MSSKNKLKFLYFLRSNDFLTSLFSKLMNLEELVLYFKKCVENCITSISEQDIFFAIALFMSEKQRIS